jgi:hypothetical protein
MKGTAIGVLMLLSLSGAFAQRAPEKPDIIERLMPGGVPTRLRLPTEADRPRAIQRLKVVQAESSGKRAQQAAFLLAVLRSDYAANRHYLLVSLRGCIATPPRDCDEDTAAFVAALYRRGDHSLLPQLMKIGPSSDGALSEFLGNFYADVLVGQPQSFVTALRPFAPLAQRSICDVAGGRDGGGMSPKELQSLHRQLNHIGGNTAERCLAAVEHTNDEIHAR